MAELARRSVAVIGSGGFCAGGCHRSNARPMRALFKTIAQGISYGLVPRPCISINRYLLTIDIF
jgi:hypothetical protein